MSKNKQTLNRDLFKKVLTLIEESWGNEDIEVLIKQFDLNKLP